MTPWTDRAGTVSPLKASVFAACFVPGLWLAGAFLAGALGPRPLTELIHHTGLWTIRLVVLTLAVTPLRQMWRWPGLVHVRRMIGVAALAYALLHLVAYAADQSFVVVRIASEIVLRLYLTVGFAALLLLVPLGITSTDGMLRRLGGKVWRRLHRLTYAIALLGIVHFFWQAKLEAAEAVVIGGLLVFLFGYRALLPLFARPPVPLLWTVLLAAAAVALTALGEAAYYHLRFGAPFARVLDATFVFDAGWRPAWAVGAIMAGAVAIATVRAWIARRRGTRPRRKALNPAAVR